MKRVLLIWIFLIGTAMFVSCESPASFPYLDAQITVEGNVFLSFDQTNWKTSLSTQDFNVYLSEKYQSFQFAPVTTETGRPPFYEVTDIDKRETNTGYYEIPLYFKSENLNRIKWKSAALSSLPVTWSPSVDFRSGASNVNANDEIQASLVNAIRVSITGLIENENQTIVYERPQGYHHNHVLGVGGDLSGDGIGVPGFLSYYYENYQKLLYGASHVICPPTVTQVRESSELYVTDLNYDNDAYFGWIVLRIWIERWDADSYPVLYDKNFSLSLVFVGVKSD